MNDSRLCFKQRLMKGPARMVRSSGNQVIRTYPIVPDRMVSLFSVYPFTFEFSKVLLNLGRCSDRIFPDSTNRGQKQRITYSLNALCE